MEVIMDFGRKYLVWSLGYAAVGIALGIFMAASGNHTQFDAHSHVLLVGFVVSFVYAVIHKLWLGEKPPRVAGMQFLLHQAGAVAMFLGLFMLYGNVLPEAQLAPVLGIASVAVFVAALLMTFMVIRGL
jgi:hypothetical protein